MRRWTFSHEFVFHLGVLGHAGYLSDVSKPFMDVCAFIAILIVPFVALLAAVLLRENLRDPPPPSMPSA